MSQLNAKPCGKRAPTAFLPRPRTTTFACKLAAAALLAIFTAALAHAQDIKTGVTYICSGEKMFVENCNIRDTSDTSTCMVGHPDHIQPNGLMQYTTETRGKLRKLFPTCQQPSAQQLAAADAFQKKQQATYDANVQKANNQLNAANQSVTFGPPQKPKTADERAMNRCVTSGRLPSSCLGNSMLGAFGQMLSSVLPSAGGQQPTSGPTMAGVFEGPGGWRLDFIDGGVLVNCSSLSPNQESYTLNLIGARPTLTINTRPKPLVLTLRTDGTIAGPGPVTIDGVVASGTAGGGSTQGHYENQQVTTHQEMSALEAQTHAGESGLTNNGEGTYDLARTSTQSTYVPGTPSPAYATFSPRRATCPALNLSSKGARVGIQTMQTDLLKSMLGGDKGPPTPPGIRMHGIFAAPTGFSVEFYPESAILGCGPDTARAYPYTVASSGAATLIRIDAPDHPLTLTFKPDGSLDPTATGPYQVHGRTITGQNGDDDFTFAPLEQACNLAALTPAKAIPSAGGAAASATMTASTGGNLSTPGATRGNATLSIVSELPGAPNPLAAHPYTLLHDSIATIVQRAGVTIPPGSSAYKVLGLACGNHTPDCQKILDGLKASAATAVRSDANGAGTFPAVAPGIYYLMITANYNNRAITWGEPVMLKPGANSVTLSLSNATPIN